MSATGWKVDVEPSLMTAYQAVMNNGPERAEFWKTFVLNRCQYPAVDRLRGQLEQAEFFDFCPCGCNSFQVKPSEGAPPLVRPVDDEVGRSAIFTADFSLPEGRTLEVILLADPAGNLDYIEIDCCQNSAPVPDVIPEGLTPIATQAYGSLLH